MEYRPLRIKAELFPYESCDVPDIVNSLCKSGLIQVYTVNGVDYIKVTKFLKHQQPHSKEKSKGYPEPGASTVPAPCQPCASTSASTYGNLEQGTGDLGASPSLTKFSFNGRILRLTQGQMFVWEQLYPTLNVIEHVRNIDATYAREKEETGNVAGNPVARCQKALENAHKKALAEKGGVNV